MVGRSGEEDRQRSTGSNRVISQPVIRSRPEHTVILHELTIIVKGLCAQTENTSCPLHHVASLYPHHVQLLPVHAEVGAQELIHVG